MLWLFTPAQWALPLYRVGSIRLIDEADEPYAAGTPQIGRRPWRPEVPTRRTPENRVAGWGWRSVTSHRVAPHFA